MEQITQIGPYTVGRVLGEGCNALVREAFNSETKKKSAIKFLKKTSIPESFKLECEILSQINHPNIIKLYEVIETPDLMAAAMEYCSGGDLLIYIQQMERLSQPETKRIFVQILSAVRYLHDQRIIHRDLKAENILLDEHKNPKLGDFGFAGYYNPEGQLNKSCGSLHYAAPELCEGKSYKGPEVDIWSLGVLLYGMITGTLPFDGFDAKEIITKICAGQFYLSQQLITQTNNHTTKPKLKSIPKHETHQEEEDTTKLIDLIRSILKVNPLQRATLEEIETHPWITGKPRDPIDELFNSNNRIFASLLNEEEKNSLSASQKFRKLILSSTNSMREKEREKGPAGSVREKKSRRGTGNFSSPKEPDLPEEGPVVLRRRRTKTTGEFESDSDPTAENLRKAQETNSNDKAKNVAEPAMFDDSEKYSLRNIVTKMFRSKKITPIQRRASFSDSPMEGGTPGSLYTPGHFGDILNDLGDLNRLTPPRSPGSNNSSHPQPRSPSSPKSPRNSARHSIHSQPTNNATSTTSTSTSSPPPPDIPDSPSSPPNNPRRGEDHSGRNLNRPPSFVQTIRENKTTIKLLKSGKRTGSIIFRKKNDKPGP